MPNKLPMSAPHITLSFPRKMIYTALAVVCVLIGLLGLIIPVIPGILFLIGAIYLLSKVSSRVHRWSEGQSWMTDIKIRLVQLGELRPLDKTRFLLLLAAKNVVHGLQRLTATVARVMPGK